VGVSNPHADQEPFWIRLLRLLGFVFLILGVPVIIFLPSAFRMPHWWGQAVHLSLAIPLVVLSLFFAALITFRCWLFIGNWLRARPHERPLRAAIALLLAVYCVAMVWLMAFAAINELLKS